VACGDEWARRAVSWLRVRREDRHGAPESVIFGAVHLSQNAFIWQSGVLIALVGFVLGTVRHISGSTRASAIVHAAYNSLPCLALLLTGGQTFHK